MLTPKQELERLCIAASKRLITEQITTKHYKCYKWHSALQLGFDNFCIGERFEVLNSE